MVNEIHLPPSPVQPLQAGTPGAPATAGRTVEGPSFQQVLSEKLGEVQFSAHAQQRLKTRNIELSQTQLDRLSEGVNRADAKGSRESLVLMDQLAFVVSVPNRTVVTAVDDPGSRSAVFTQIDSAVFV